jgi:4-alpha-glucanotransferase
MAALNTHDMPTFAGFYKGADIDLRVELGLLRKRDASKEHAVRKRQTQGLARALRRGRLLRQRATPRSVMQAMLAYLARSNARHLLVSLEDLWLETQSQNVPGTYHEKPNWRRRARFSLDRIPGQRTVVDTLRRIQLLRSGKRKPHGR